ncbi:MAG: class I tRNA ligase family protein, partial [Eubacteriales bacterium]|nr:class I tRNA ligase family protein [Eubacteriales bacterium]
ATKQWFVSIDGFGNDALEAIKDVTWIPEWGEDRISGMVRERHDWCISRQRIWGVPLPIFYCDSCGKELITENSIKAVEKLFREKGSDAWFETEAQEILGEEAVCSCGGKKFTKETDIMDVWFDSGSSHAAVLEQRADLSWPADMYLEGSDQHRGWFQSSLLTSVATKGTAPYKSVLTHGYVVDGEGRKMSKSLGNGIDPEDVIKQYGADILRLWAASSDYKVDIRISPDMLKQLSEAYRKVRNTCRFILGNIYDFEPNKDSVRYGQLEEIDRWALLRLSELIEKVDEAYRDYEFHTMFHAIHNFCIVDMSNFYLDIIKDRLYTSKADSPKRRAAQTAMFEVIEVLVRILAPVLAFTSEEIWKYMPHRKGDDSISVQMNDWPEVNPEYLDSSLNEKWDKIIRLREDVSKALEIARANKKLGQSLMARVTVYAEGENLEFFGKIKSEMADIFIVSDVQLLELSKAQGVEDIYKSENYENVSILISQAPGHKCERCWMYSETVGSDNEHPDVCERCAKVISE